MTIRPAAVDDCETIAWIVRESYRNLSARHIPLEMPIYRGEHHRRMMSDPALRWALVCEDDLPVGVASWRMIPGMAHLHLLFVEAAHQHRGYGVRLLHHHQDAARAEDSTARLFTLHCLRDSAWAMRFYKHQGYTLYEPGDEGRLTDLYLWIDACRRYDNGWPIAPEKALWYKRAVS